MPSPFPGMDPYVEHAEIFPDFHDRFIMHQHGRELALFTSPPQIAATLDS